ncbi:homeobox-containing protein [Plasmodium falciparum RAJ116]|uniref:Homeobox-containing protein n=1 Tax=Plasmodium falciparum RAJ116 TaxID=580058 RepID=A0A0L0CTR2_PLAFA|nr:homeobox-containing protein [Plasmodium falciparum RAJ116]
MMNKSYTKLSSVRFMLRVYVLEEVNVVGLMGSQIYCEASKCTFAHTEDELRGSGKALRLCTKFFLDGNNKENIKVLIMNLNNIYYILICYCNKSDKCPMAHHISQLDPSVKFTASELMNRMSNNEETSCHKENGDTQENEDNNIYLKNDTYKNDENNVDMDYSMMNNFNDNNLRDSKNNYKNVLMDSNQEYDYMTEIKVPQSANDELLINHDAIMECGKEVVKNNQHMKSKNNLMIRNEYTPNQGKLIMNENDKYDEYIINQDVLKINNMKACDYYNKINENIHPIDYIMNSEIVDEREKKINHNQEYVYNKNGEPIDTYDNYEICKNYKLINKNRFINNEYYKNGIVTLEQNIQNVEGTTYVGSNCLSTNCVSHCLANHCLGNHCVGNNCLASNYLASNCLASNYLTSNCLASNCLASNCLANNCINNNCVTNSCINNNCVTNSCMNNNCVTNNCMNNNYLNNNYMNNNCMSNNYMNNNCMSNNYMNSNCMNNNYMNSNCMGNHYIRNHCTGNNCIGNNIYSGGYNTLRNYISNNNNNNNSSSNNNSNSNNNNNVYNYSSVNNLNNVDNMNNSRKMIQHNISSNMGCTMKIINKGEKNDIHICGEKYIYNNIKQKKDTLENSLQDEHVVTYDGCKNVLSNIYHENSVVHFNKGNESVEIFEEMNNNNINNNIINIITIITIITQ